MMAAAQWQPLQLNLPVTPITDLMVHKGNLLAATMGRGFWILDDLNVAASIRGQLPPGRILSVYPRGCLPGVGYSALDRVVKDEEDDAPEAGAVRGRIPATGVVLYYQLPEKVGFQ